MKHLLFRIMAAVWLMMCLLAVSCEQGSGERGPVSVERPLRIITTIKPLELILREALDPSLHELVDVSVLIPPDVSPHGFEPTPSQMARLRSADMVIHIGLGLDDWAVRNLPRGSVAMRFADVVSDEEHDHHEHDHHSHNEDGADGRHMHRHDDHPHDHDHHDCGHHHGPVDEHLWLDPSLVQAFAKTCIDEISRCLALDEGADGPKLQSSLQAFVAAVNETDAAFQQALNKHTSRRIVTHHNVFSRVVRRYGLGDPIVLRPVEMLEPTPGDIRRAIEAIRDESISFILVEPQFSAVAAQRIAEQTQVRLIEVDPLGTQSDSWTEMMRNLLDALLQGLEE